MSAERSTRRRRVLRRYSAEDRERLIQEYKAGGQSRREFCAEHDVNLTTFHGWLHLRSRRGRKRRKTPVATFTEVKLAGAAATPIEVLLPNGARVQIRHNGSPEDLVQLIRGVAGC